METLVMLTILRSAMGPSPADGLVFGLSAALENEAAAERHVVETSTALFPSKFRQLPMKHLYSQNVKLP